MRTRPLRLVLVGGGHSHVEVMRRFALQRVADVDATLISPSLLAVHSGMLPGLVAGHYSTADASIDLPLLAHWANARFLRDTVAGVDLNAKTLALADGDNEPFDLLSMDIGSTPGTAQIPGALEHAVPVRPAAAFATAWETLRADAADGRVSTIAVVGGGASGVELLLAMQTRLHGELGDSAPRFALITDEPQLLPDHAPALRARFGKLLVGRGVVVHLSSGAVAVEPGTVITTHHRRIAAECIVWATTPAAHAWPGTSGLACDARGFILVDSTLRSKSHPFVLAAGDCATQEGHRRPKSSAFAIRQGGPLAINLRRTVRHEPLAAFVPRRHAFSLIATGARHAVVSRGPLVLEGDWVWRWKDRRDRAFMSRFRPPGAPPASVPAAGKD